LLTIFPEGFQLYLNILESVKKIQEYAEGFKNADDFYNNNISFDATMINFIVIRERLLE